MDGFTPHFGTRLLLVFLAAAALTAGCTADDDLGLDPVDDDGVFETFDDDADGFVDLVEFRDEVDTLGLFADYDADNDGFLDEAELEEGFFDRFDDDADGFLTELEYNRGIAFFTAEDDEDQFPLFGDLDDDSDNLLSSDEFSAVDDTLFGFDGDDDDLLDDDEFGDGLFGAFDDDDDDLLDDDDFGFFD